MFKGSGHLFVTDELWLNINKLVKMYKNKKQMYIKSLYPNQNQYELWLYYLKSVLQVMLAEYLHFEPPLLCQEKPLRS